MWVLPLDNVKILLSKTNAEIRFKECRCHILYYNEISIKQVYFYQTIASFKIFAFKSICWLLLLFLLWSTISNFLDILLWFISFVFSMIILNYVSSKLTVRNIRSFLIFFEFIWFDFSPIVSFILLSVQFSEVYLCSFLLFLIFWKGIKNTLEYFGLFIVVVAVIIFIFFFFIVYCIFPYSSSSSTLINFHLSPIDDSWSIILKQLLMT